MNNNRLVVFIGLILVLGALLTRGIGSLSTVHDAMYVCVIVGMALAGGGTLNEMLGE